ncbi:hypothetical protein NL676_036209 [Syzygium grande]|nr:hypothetical protein NL676_036209 [Syzygium grande]
MARVEEPSSLPSLSENVQKLSNAAEEPPPVYFVKGGSVGPVESFPIAQIPIVDLSLLRSVSLTCSGNEQEDELEKLKSALSEWGCFQAIGHGIPTSFLDKVRVIAKEFFALPVEEKQKYARDPADLEGYGTDPVLSDEQVLDWSKRLFLNLLPLDSRKLKLWPETPEEFSVLPDTEAEIEPDEGLISEERPQIYRKLKNYAAINFECFQKSFPLPLPLPPRRALETAAELWGSGEKRKADRSGWVLSHLRLLLVASALGLSLICMFFLGLFSMRSSFVEYAAEFAAENMNKNIIDEVMRRDEDETETL